MKEGVFMSMDNIHEEIMVSWDQAMMTDQIPDLHKNIEQLIKLMTDGILNRDYENLELLFQAGTKRIEAWGNWLNFEVHKEYNRVFSYAIFWISK